MGMSFAEFMADSFRSETPLVWDYPAPGVVTARFRAHEVPVVVTFEEREPGGPWHALFEVENAGGTAVARAALRIFNGVFQAAEEFLSVREPLELVFATKSDDLHQIYATYLRREANTIRRLGYEIEGPVRMEPYIEYRLTRTRPSNWR